MVRLATRALSLAAAALLLSAAGPAPNSVSGTVQTIIGTDLLLRSRSGGAIHVDAADAVAGEQSQALRAGLPVTVTGLRDASGVLHASAITRAKTAPALWPADR
jgi:hypothetical protein